MNRYGNWRGYEGKKFVKEFGNSSFETAEEAARQWVYGITPYGETLEYTFTRRVKKP